MFYFKLKLDFFHWKKFVLKLKLASFKILFSTMKCCCTQYIDTYLNVTACFVCGSYIFIADTEINILFCSWEVVHENSGLAFSDMILAVKLYGIGKLFLCARLCVNHNVKGRRTKRRYLYIFTLKKNVRIFLWEK